MGSPDLATPEKSTPLTCCGSMVNLPLVIEFFDTPKVVDAALALLDGLVPSGHILSWRAELRKLPVTAPAGS